MYSIEDLIWRLQFVLRQRSSKGLTTSHPRLDAPKLFFLREIIEQGIQEMEDYYLAADVLARVRQGKEQVHSAADVRKGLGFGD
jgi:RHH-type rel operon transcriptional repressor/antitoxin RelB